MTRSFGNSRIVQTVRLAKDSRRLDFVHADMENHQFTYSLFPHAGRLQESGAIEEAYNLNAPPMEEGSFTFTIQPFEIVTVKLRLRGL